MLLDVLCRGKNKYLDTICNLGGQDLMENTGGSWQYPDLMKQKTKMEVNDLDGSYQNKKQTSLDKSLNAMEKTCTMAKLQRGEGVVSSPLI